MAVKLVCFFNKISKCSGWLTTKLVGTGYAGDKGLFSIKAYSRAWPAPNGSFKNY